MGVVLADERSSLTTLLMELGLENLASLRPRSRCPWYPRLVKLLWLLWLLLDELRPLGSIGKTRSCARPSLDCCEGLMAGTAIADSEQRAWRT